MFEEELRLCRTNDIDVYGLPVVLRRTGVVSYGSESRCFVCCIPPCVLKSQPELQPPFVAASTFAAYYFSLNVLLL